MESPPIDGLSLLLTLSHVIMVFAWGWATTRLWKLRHMPHGNHALAAAVAMVLAQSALFLKTNIPMEVLVYFIAMAQLTLVISFVRVTQCLDNVKTKVGKLAGFGIVLASLGNLLLSAR